jgi:hypothetical protein
MTVRQRKSTDTPCHKAQKTPRGKVLKVLFWLVLALAAVTFVTGALTQWRIINLATKISLADSDLRSATIPPGTAIRNSIVPTFGIDGCWWIMHAEEMIRSKQLRVRSTDLDNAPDGREVHWSSGIIWLLAVGAVIFQHLGYGNLQESVTLAAVFVGPLIFLIFATTWFFLVRWIFDSLTAALSIFLFTSIPPVFSMFQFGNCDHHGLVSAFLLVGVFLFTCGLLAWEGCLPKVQKPELLNKASAVLLAAGLWVSAATALPVLAALGAGLCGRLLLTQKLTLSVIPLGACRKWALMGCLSSIAFYLLEYFPFHMGWRLEVNHPLYAIAWLAGGELLERVNRKASGGMFLHFNIADILTLATTVVLCTLPAVLIKLSPETFFWVSDRFLLHLHQWHINEFQPFFDALDEENILLSIFHCFIWPILVVATLGLAWRFRRLDRRVLVALLPALCVTVSGFCMAMIQVRWIGPDLAQWAALVVIVCGLLAPGLKSWPRRTRWILALPALVLLINPFFSIVKWAYGESKLAGLPKEMAPNIVLRDVVQRILMMDPQKKPRILCAPTSSTQVAFYSGAEVLGTLYWENKDGLKAAAEIFASRSEDDTKKLIEKKGITHILLFSWDEFVVEYAKLLADAKGQSIDENQLFIKKLISQETPPHWLKPLYYPIPQAFDLKDQKVMLYQVVPDQSDFDYHLNLGLYQYDAGKYDRAIEEFEIAGTKNPAEPKISKLIEFCRQEQSKQKKP